MDIDKVKQEVAGLRSDLRFNFKLNNEMMSFLVINGFFFTVLLFIQLIWFFVTSYSSFVGWWAFASAFGLFYLFLRPSTNEKQNVQGYFENFNSSVLWHPKNIYKPTSVSEIASLIKDSAAHGKKIRVYGGGSAFNAIGQSKQNVIVLDNFKSVQINDKTATVGAGLTIGELAAALYENHLSIPSLGWFDAQSVGSAVSTTSHANSLKHGSLASRVVSLELVNGNGEVVNASESENEDVFNAARGGLGLLGVVTSVTFSCDVATNFKKTTSVVSLDEASSDLSGRANSNEYYTIWWVPHINKANLVILNKTSERTAAEKSGNAPVSPVVQYQTLAVTFAHKFLFTIYYKVLFTVAAVVEIVNNTALGFFASSLKPQDSIVTSKDGLLEPFFSLLPRWSETEYFVPLENAQAAFKDLQQSVRTGGWVINFPARVGFVKADSHWLSENYNSDCITFSLAMFNKGKWTSFSQKVDKIMKNYGGKPHWAKTHSLNKQELEQLYPKWNDFSEVRKRFDPQGVFLNEYLEKIFA